MRSPSYLRAALVGALAVVLAGCVQPPGQRVAGPAPVERSEPPLLATTAAPLELRPGHPSTYVVQRGDTLWDIAARFLSDPWRWPEIWRRNPAIENPDLIYPGDVLEVFYEADQPRLRLASGRSGGPRPTIRLSPRVRIETLPQPIPTVPRQAIEPFLSGNRIMSQAEWEAAPYVVGTVEERLLMASGDRIYARGALFDQPRYRLFRPGEEYHDPVSGNLLGFNLVHVGDAVLEQDGDPATLRLTGVVHGVQAGDRLFEPNELDEADFDLLPRPAFADTEGEILDVLNGEFLIGRHHTVVLDLGEADAVEPGQVLEIYAPGRVVIDPLTGAEVPLPENRSGLVMVYRVFDRLSYALVTEASRTIRLHDRVRNP